MDPSYVSFPAKSGYFRVSQKVSPLYYELRTAYNSPFSPKGVKSAGAGHEKVLFLMGAFGTHQHFHEMADHLASNGYEVLLMDHRGVGKSGPCSLEGHTTSLLAADALALLDHVWGVDARVHVYGASMGGMVAQELALLLIKQRRLASLYLAVTCAGRMMLANRLPFQLGRLLLNLYVVRLLVPLLFGWPKRLMVLRLLQKCFRAECLAAPHPSGATYRELYQREYLKNFRDLWAFGDHNACAGHVVALAGHHLGAAKAAAIRASGVRVTVQVATHDALVPAAMQLELAALLDARVAAYHTGHVGWHLHKEEIFAELRCHLAGGRAVGLGAVA